jgi:hypothetical protein
MMLLFRWPQRGLKHFAALEMSALTDLAIGEYRIKVVQQLYKGKLTTFVEIWAESFAE